MESIRMNGLKEKYKMEIISASIVMFLYCCSK